MLCGGEDRREEKGFRDERRGLVGRRQGREEVIEESFNSGVGIVVEEEGLEGCLVVDVEGMEGEGVAEEDGDCGEVKGGAGGMEGVRRVEGRGGGDGGGGRRGGEGVRGERARGEGTVMGEC